MDKLLYYSKNARQCIIGEDTMPARPRDPQGLEGIISPQ